MEPLRLKFKSMILFSSEDNGLKFINSGEVKTKIRMVKITDTRMWCLSRLKYFLISLSIILWRFRL